MLSHVALRNISCLGHRESQTLVEEVNDLRESGNVTRETTVRAEASCLLYPELDVNVRVFECVHQGAESQRVRCERDEPTPGLNHRQDNSNGNVPPAHKSMGEERRIPGNTKQMQASRHEIAKKEKSNK